MSDQQKILTNALEAHGYDDWYSALLHAAIEETQDAAEAVRAADEAHARQPSDPAMPQDDDADALFGAEESVAMSAEHADELATLYDDVRRAAKEARNGTK